MERSQEFILPPFFHKSVLPWGHEIKETFVIPENDHRAMEFIQECYQRGTVSSSYRIYLKEAMGKNKTLNFFLQVSSLLSYFIVFVSFYLEGINVIILIYFLLSNP